MSGVEKIDKNLAIHAIGERDKLYFHDIEDGPFKIYGVKKENGMFRRLPETIARSVSEGVYELHTFTAGGRVRFVTDSECVAIHAEIAGKWLLSHMPTTGVSGLDMYAREGDIEKFVGVFKPPYDMKDGYESILYFGDKKERLVTINFPLYSSLVKLYVGLEKNAYLREAPEYKNSLPVVYYGSSITQGACASRPGNCYENRLTRYFDCDYINLGFAGSAKGEDTIAEWISQMKMSVFVYDYDYNAPSTEHLEKTHSKMFQRIRKANPNLPVIMMSRPKYYLSEAEKKRLAIIRATYEEAVAAGDENVYLLDNQALTQQVKDDGTVDNCHPTDSGFANMASALIPIFEHIYSRTL